MSKIKRLFSTYTRSILTLALALSALSLKAEVDPKVGFKLFKDNCKRCHYATDQKFTGPGLAGSRARWNNDEAKLIQWVKNSSSLIKAGDAYAVKLYNEFGQQQMPAFGLSDDEIRSIFAYIDDPAAAGDVPPAKEEAKKGEDGKPAKKDNTTLILLLIGAAVVLFVVARALSGVTRAMDNVKREREGGEILPERKPFDFFVNLRNWISGHKKISAVIGLLIVGWVSLQAFWSLNDIGVHTNYQPKQEIAFSHKIHAGQNGIQCQYCHIGVAESRHASIPSTNVCMNCHKGVSEGSVTGKSEIVKIYASIGWNPVDLKYFPEGTSKTEIEKKLAEHLGDDADAFKVAKKFVNKPIEWVQVYNLPDHAYFNHSQHVVVGKVECKTCHGEVEKMDEISQFTPLTMGWCINCHRETKVQYADNKYYERLHDYYKQHYGEYEMQKGQPFTVEKIGGLECSKCHY